MTPEERVALEARIDELFRSYNKWAKFWSSIHHSSIYLVTGLSALTAIFLQINQAPFSLEVNDFGTVLTGIVAFLSAVSVSVGFHRKWSTTRASRNRVELLRVELISAETTAASIQEKLIEILEAHNEGIVGEG